MTLPAPTYDLVVLLDPQAEEDVRAKLVADARKAIEAQGELLRHDEWGTRTMAYPIDRKTVAEYHLLQFHAGAPELLGGLERSLRLADDILRFRIIKLKPGVPDAPDMKSASAASTTTPEPTPRAEPSAPPSEPQSPAEPVEPAPAAAAEESTVEVAAEAEADPEPQPADSAGAAPIEDASAEAS